MRYCPELPPPGCCCQARGNTIVFKMFQQLHSRPSKASGGPPVMTFKAPARTCLHQFEKADAADHSKAAKKCQKMYCTWCKHVQTFRFWYSALPCVTLRYSAAMPLPGSQAHLVVHQLLPPTPPRRNTSRTPGAMASAPRCSRQPRLVPP